MSHFLIEVQSERISLETAYPQLLQSEHGAQLFFLGVVRNQNAGKRVIAVEYDIHIFLAKLVFQQICEEAYQQWGPALKVMLTHRMGRLEVGEASVFVAVGSPHRMESYQASQYIIHELKRRAPIWKKEYYQDGETLWLEGHALCEVSI